MIIFLYGEDSYRSKKKLEEIIEEYRKVHENGLSLIKIDAGQENFKYFFDSFRTASMFNEKKLVVLENVFSNQKFQEGFFKDIKALKDSKDIVIIFEKDKPDQKNKLFKTLLKNAKCQEFNFLDDRGLKVWFERESEKQRLKIDNEAQNILLSYTGNDLWRLENEIKKLANFKPGKLIKKEDVILQVRPKLESNIFKTIDAVSKKDKKQALLFLHEHLENGDNPLYLLSMISYQLRNLLIIKEMADKGLSFAAIQRKSGLAPFLVSKTYYLCSQFSFSELKKIYQKIFQADLNIKTGKVDAQTALDLLVASI